MTKPNMTTERVLELIDIYGADLYNWPDDERVPAAQLISANLSAFEEAFEFAKALDLALASAEVPELSNRLADVILSEAPQLSAATSTITRRAWRRFIPSGMRVPASAVFASLGVGLVAGYSYAGDNSFDTYLETDTSYNYAVEDSFEDWIGQMEEST